MRKVKVFDTRGGIFGDSLEEDEAERCQVEYQE
jgi:hypothetical protein